MGAPMSSCARSVIFLGGVTEQALYEGVSAAWTALFGEDSQGAGRDDQVDVIDSCIVFEGTQHLDGKDGAAGAGDGENQVGANWIRRFAYGLRGGARGRCESHTARLSTTRGAAG